MGKRKRKQVKPVDHEPPGSSAFWLMLREVGERIRPQSGNALMVLAFAQLLLGLAFLGVVANHYSAATPSAFGAQIPRSEIERRTRIDPAEPPVSLRASILFGVFTAGVWGFLVSRRKRMGGREIRFLAMLLGPGTVMAIIVIVLAAVH